MFLIPIKDENKNNKNPKISIIIKEKNLSWGTNIHIFKDNIIYVFQEKDRCIKNDEQERSTKKKKNPTARGKQTKVRKNTKRKIDIKQKMKNKRGVGKKKTPHSPGKAQQSKKKHLQPLEVIPKTIFEGAAVIFIISRYVAMALPNPVLGSPFVVESDAAVVPVDRDGLSRIRSK